MRLTLRTLQFERTANGSPAAIPVRRGRADEAPLVDWERTGASVVATAVIYPIALARRAPESIAVHVSFEADAGVAEAVLAQPVHVRAHGGHRSVLGDIAAREVADLTAISRFTLAGPRLKRAAVGLHVVEWTWEWSQDGREWREFARSSHEVFVTLDTPDKPWGTPGAPRSVVPWDAMTALACRWAVGARSVVGARELVTQSVDGLAGKRIGDRRVEWTSAGSLCSGPTFYVDSFLKIVNGDPRAPSTVNCHDLNTAVALMLALLGARTRVLRFRARDVNGEIETNRIRLFGMTSACVKRFNNHAIAGIGNGASPDEDLVCDACLRVDVDEQPESPPSLFRLATGLPLTENRADLGYRRRLLKPCSRDCPVEPVWGDGIRYPGKVPPGVTPPPADPYVEAEKTYYANLLDLTASAPLLTSQLAEWILANADPEAFARRVDLRPAGAAPVTIHFTPIRVGDETRGAMSIAKAASRAEAVDVLLTLAAESTTRLERLTGFGDVALRDPQQGAILMLRDRLVIEVHGSGILAPEHSFDAARWINRRLDPFFSFRA